MDMYTTEGNIRRQGKKIIWECIILYL